MKLNKLSVVLAVLIIAILAIGAVSAESIDDSDVSVADDASDTISIDSINDVSVEPTDKNVKTGLSAVALGDDDGDDGDDDVEIVSYNVSDDTYSNYFNVDGTRTEALDEMGDYILNIGTLTNKDMIIDSGSNINIIAKDNEGFINNGTIVIGDGAGSAGSIYISGLTFNNTNKNAIEVLDYSTDITISDNKMDILGIASETSAYSIYGITSNGYVSGLYIENNNISVEGDISFTYGIGIVANRPDYTYAEYNPEDIIIEGNEISVNKTGSSGCAEAMYLDNVVDVTVIDNTVTVESSGCSAYGIQIADSSMYVLYEDEYDGELTSPNDILIDGNTFILNSDFMIYGITTTNYGWDTLADSSYSFPLNITIYNNNVYANSKKGVMGIAGKLYNMTVFANTLYVSGGSAEGLDTGDSEFGNDTFALGVIYTDIYDDGYMVVVKDNTVFTNVTKEKLNDDKYAEYVIFENNGELVTTLIDDDNYDNYFDENGYLKESVLGDYANVVLGNLTNKALFINIPLNINSTEDGKLINSTITLLEGADDTIVKGLTFEFAGDENTGSTSIIYVIGANNIAILDNNIVVTEFAECSTDPYGTMIYAINIESGEDGCDDVLIGRNNIEILASCAYAYGISAFQTWGSENAISYLIIANNNISISNDAGMSEAVYAYVADELIIAYNNITSESYGHAYGIGTDNTTNSNITFNDVKVDAGEQAYGITSTTADTVKIANNTVLSDGVGAIGIGTTGEDISIADNTITVIGGDYTSIYSWDILGTANAAILDKTGNAVIGENDITEHIPLVIDDGNYDVYFDDEGYIRNDSGIEEGDLIFFDQLTNKNIVIDIPLTIKGATGNILNQTTITLLSEASGSSIENLDMEFTGDNTTGSVGLIYVNGASDIGISGNTIFVPDFVDKAGAKYGSSLYAIEIESGADGCSYILINNNLINIKGSSRYLYGIDVFKTYGSENGNSYIAIADNVIYIDPASRMAEGIYASDIDYATIEGNHIVVEGDAAAYGIGTDSLTNSSIKDNYMEVTAGTQAYGITSTNGDGINVTDNNITSTGEGAVGVGSSSENVAIDGNTITVNGGDYTSITTTDTLGTANAAILDVTGDAEIGENTITENIPITIDDDNYDLYFDENGEIRNDSGIEDNDLIFLDQLTNKNIVLTMPLTVKGAPGNKLVNTTIDLKEGADNTEIANLNFDYTDDGTGYGIISINDGVSYVAILNNNITAESATGSNSAMGIVVYGAPEGSENIVIDSNNIVISGDEAYTYGIDIQNYDTAWTKGEGATHVLITNNFISLSGNGMEEAIYLSNANKVIVYENEILSVSTAIGKGNDAYGIGVNAVEELTIEQNTIAAESEQMAFGIAVTTNSKEVNVLNNTIAVDGTGAIGVGVAASDNVSIDGNYISVIGGDYTSIETWDSLGTANAAILDLTGEAELGENTVTGSIPITIDDDVYDLYFDENGEIREDCGIEEDDLIFLDQLTNKNIVLTMPLTVKGAPGNKLVNTTIALKEGADNTEIANLNFDYTDDGTGFGIISINDGVSYVAIHNNNITAESAAGYNSAMAIVVYGAPEGSENIVIDSNNMVITGDAAYTYGIDIQNYDTAWTKGEGATKVLITNNFLSLMGSGMEEAIYLSNAKDVIVYNNEILSVSNATGKGNDAYGLAANTVEGLIVEQNIIAAESEQMAFGIAVTTNSEDVEVLNNTIAVDGTGAIGVGVAASDNVSIDDNYISVIGEDYTSIETWDSLGTANAAILDKTGEASVENNTIVENIPFIIDDTSYDKYFTEEGYIREDAPIEAGDTLLIGLLSDKNIIIDVPVEILPATVSKLTDSTITVIEGGDGTSIKNLDIEFTGDETTGSVGIIYVLGANNVSIENNNIAVPDFVNKEGASWGSSLYAIEVESGASGTDGVKIVGNNIEINGSANYLYGIDAFATWGSNATNSNLEIQDNNITINGGSRMAEAIYVSESENVTVSGNDILIDADAAAYGIGTDRLDHAKIIDNNIGVETETAGYGITATTSGEDILIEDNDVFVVGTSAVGVGLSGQDTAVVKDNKIEIVGGDYASVSSADSLGTANAAVLDKDNKNTNLVLENNTLVENGKPVNTTHSGNASAELQALIDAAPEGSVLDLDGVIYSGVSDVVIDKNLTITNGVISGKAGEAIFVVPAKSAGGPDEVNITGNEFLVNNGNTIVKATADNGTTPTSIDTPAISITNNTVLSANDDVVADSVTVLKLESERGSLAPTSPIAVEGNTLDSGVDPFEFDVTGVSDDDGNTIIPEGGNIPQREATVLVVKNMTTTAITKTADRNGEYFVFKLTDANGKILVNKTVQVGFNGNVYTRTTNENGTARVQVNLIAAGGYTFAVSYLGDDNYNASFAVAKITVNKQKGTLTAPTKSYKSTAKTKSLTTTFKDSKGKVVSGKKVTFTVNGKSYTATTNSKGVATVKVSLSTKKTYSYTVKFAGDNTFAAITKTGKVTIK